MNPYMVLIEIGGAVILLLWAVRMIRTGVERSQEPALRALLREGRGGRLKAAAVGGSVAIMLQSATAVAMLAAGFAANGSLSLATGLAMMLGADLGSAIAVRILSISHEWVAPLLLLLGGALFFRGFNRTIRQAGRIVLGIALVLISLRMLGEATSPLRSAEALPQVVTYLSMDYITAFIVGALFTWLVHSSVAAILMVMAFSQQGLIPIELGVSLVLGANLGGGLVAFGLTRTAAVEAQRIVIGNLMMRGLAAVALLALYHTFRPAFSFLGGDAAQQLLNLHLAFNILILTVNLPCVGLVARLVQRLVRDSAMPSLAASAPSYLDRAAVDRPQQALSNAKRELLRMAEIVERMLQPIMDLYETGDAEQIRQIRQMEDAVNRAQSDITLYLVQIQHPDADGEDALRGRELANFTVNLEHVGDAISKTLLKLAETRRNQKLKFSPEGWRELNELHHRVLRNMQLALNVLVSEDRESARLLVSEKQAMREAERSSIARHLGRLSKGGHQSIETSDIHLETVRAFRAINSMLVTVAYPILSRTGDLLDSRLTMIK